MRLCPACHKHVPPTHFYPKCGKPRCASVLKWPLARRFKVMTLIEQGRSNAQIARAVGATEAAIVIMRKKYKLDRTTDSTLTARHVAKLMGLGCAKSVTHWIESGFLKGRHGYHQGSTRIWMVDRDELYRFIADEATWHVWRPERIADPELRRYADKVRGGVRFLTTREAGYELYVEHSAINGWIHRGIIPARRWGNWWIDERDVALLKEERSAA